jgi:hypothetical protein
VIPLSIRIITEIHTQPLPSHIAVVAFVAVALCCHHEPIQISPQQTTLQSIRLLLTWLQPEMSGTLMAAKG